MNFRQVTKKEFVQYIKSYPKKLEWDCTGIREPPLGSYNDFSDGKIGPESLVARICLNESMKGRPTYNGELNEYYLKI